MLLAIDIGNTHSVFGVLRGTEIVHRLRVTTSRQRTADEWAMLLDNFARNRGITRGSVGTAVIGSVVPGLTPAVNRAAAAVFGPEPFTVTAATVPGFRTRYENPAGIGPDRIANAVAAHARYAEPCIVVDLGTATTYDVVAADGEYLGGVIVPGMETSFDGLSRRAAMLPRVELKMPDRVVGTTTQACMQSGIMFGTADQVRGIVKRIERELGTPCRVILTGGLAVLFMDELGGEAEIDTDLTLEGLRLIAGMAGLAG